MFIEQIVSNIVLEKNLFQWIEEIPALLTCF